MARQTLLWEKPLISFFVTMGTSFRSYRKVSATSRVRCVVQAFHMTSTRSSSTGVIKLMLKVFSFLPWVRLAPMSELFREELLLVR